MRDWSSAKRLLWEISMGFLPSSDTSESMAPMRPSQPEKR